jgi:hypothetical protein
LSSPLTSASSRKLPMLFRYQLSNPTLQELNHSSSLLILRDFDKAVYSSWLPLIVLFWLQSLGYPSSQPLLTYSLETSSRWVGDNFFNVIQCSHFRSSFQ